MAFRFGWCPPGFDPRSTALSYLHKRYSKKNRLFRIRLFADDASLYTFIIVDSPDGAGQPTILT